MYHSILTTLLVISCLQNDVYSQTASTYQCYTPRPSHPGACLDKYAVIPNHMNCVNSQYSGIPTVPTASEKVEIEQQHNSVRTNVNPKPGDMMELSYSGGLEGSARRWSQKCITEANTWYQRASPGAFNPGQNTLVSDTQLTWKQVIDTWTSENTSFTYSGTNDLQKTSNYTQMIWAETTTVGCAYSQCRTDKTFWFYVCHYAPMFDEAKADHPYQSGKAFCEHCPSHCNSNSTNTLCDCAGVLCLGGSTLDLNTCQCSCIQEVKTYNGTLCELVCEAGGDDPTCGSGDYTKATCGTNLNTMFRCPWLCDICPYAGEGYKQGSVLLPSQKGLPECTTTTTTPTPKATQALGGTATPAASNAPTGSATNGPTASTPTATQASGGTAKPAASNAPTVNGPASTSKAAVAGGTTNAPGGSKTQQGGGNSAPRKQPVCFLLGAMAIFSLLMFIHRW